jgi:4-amino-4-deoxychorismate lyase
LVKCRILYDQSVQKIEFHHYKPKLITSLKCVYSDLDYHFKWVDRKELDQLFLQKALCDDILIIKDHKVTDTYYANTAFYLDEKWFTPKQPLLKGSQRAKLIQNSRLIEKDIFLSDLANFTKVAVFNAMRPFGELILPINAIFHP